MSRLSIALKNPIWWKMDFKKDHQNTFAENQNSLYAILERNFSRDSNPTICSSIRDFRAKFFARF